MPVSGADTRNTQTPACGLGARRAGPPLRRVAVGHCHKPTPAQPLRWQRIFRSHAGGCRRGKQIPHGREGQGGAQQ